MKKYLMFVLILALAIPAMVGTATRATAYSHEGGATASQSEPIVTGVERAAGQGKTALIADHTSVNINAVPQAWIEEAKNTLHIAYGHTSHGSQVTGGMSGLVGFANGGGRGLALPEDIFAWNNGGTDGALDLHDYAMDGDVGYYPAWVNNTRSYLGTPNANGRGTNQPDVNVIMWSWCGQASGYSQQDMLDKYLLPMTQLEADYPGITFVYMTGHSDGSGLDGNLHQRNQQIREYVVQNHKVLFDFYDIESYDPDGAYYGDKHVDDGCNYDSDGNGSQDKNWATDWQTAHTQNVDWYSCSCAHSEALNCNQKAYAIWWLWAKLAGWGGSGPHYVAPDGNCHGRTPCYETVQAAVEAASDGAEIRLATGTYTNTAMPLISISKTLMLRGGYNADFSLWDPAAYPTTLDGRGQDGWVVSVSGNVSPTLEGLGVTGGDASAGDGGGIQVVTATVTISRCRVFSNAGVGVLLSQSQAVLSGNTIVSNTAGIVGTGGGVAARDSDATFTDNAISGNSAHLGGGLALGPGHYVLNQNTISGNTVSSGGGGMYLNGGSAVLNGNIISANSATISGSGLLLQAGTARSANDVIADNQTSIAGNGLSIHESTAHLLHTTIARNGKGSGVHIRHSSSSPHSTVLMTNTLLVSHTLGISVTGGNTLRVNGVLWDATPITVSQSSTATVMVQNQRSGDAAFAADGYHLTGGSAAINAGVASGLSTDIDGEPRSDGHPDLGVDEVLAGLQVTKQAQPDPVQPGGPLTYTIRITNTGVMTLHVTATDTLPLQVMSGTTPGGTPYVPGGTIVWNGLVIAPGAAWTTSFVVTVIDDYTGSLTNVVVATSTEGAGGNASVVTTVGEGGHRIYLPMILKQRA